MDGFESEASFDAIAVFFDKVKAGSLDNGLDRRVIGMTRLWGGIVVFTAQVGQALDIYRQRKTSELIEPLRLQIDISVSLFLLLGF